MKKIFITALFGLLLLSFSGCVQEKNTSFPTKKAKCLYCDEIGWNDNNFNKPGISTKWPDMEDFYCTELSYSDCAQYILPQNETYINYIENERWTGNYEGANTNTVDCSKNIYNCGDFKSQSEAQSIYIKCGGSSNDVHILDRDDDGTACETYKYSSTNSGTNKKNVTIPSQACCKYCSKGKACGNSCISRTKTCHQPPGCACNK